MCLLPPQLSSDDCSIAKGDVIFSGSLGGWRQVQQFRTAESKNLCLSGPSFIGGSAFIGGRLVL